MEMNYQPATDGISLDGPILNFQRNQTSVPRFVPHGAFPDFLGSDGTKETPHWTQKEIPSVNAPTYPVTSLQELEQFTLSDAFESEIPFPNPFISATLHLNRPFEGYPALRILV
jgi:hypothetical protein